MSSMYSRLGRARPCLAVILLALAGCHDAREAADAASSDAASSDGASSDGAAADASDLDAPLADAGLPDAASPDAGPTFTLQVLDLGVPQAGIDVVLGHADGSVALTLLTDAAGRVATTVQPGDMITALWARAGERHAQTLVGLLPVEDLVVDIGTFVAPPPGAALATVSVSVGALPDGTATVLVTSGCDDSVGASAPIVAPLVLVPHAACHVSGSFVVLASAHRADGAVLGYQVVPTAPGSSVTLADAWSAPETRTASLDTDVTAQRENARFALGVRLGSADFPYPQGARRVFTLDVEQDYTHFPVLMGSPDLYYAAVEAPAGQGAGRHSQLKITRDVAPWDSFFDFDFPSVVVDGHLVPGAPARPTLTWTNESAYPGGGGVTPSPLMFRVRGSSMHWTVMLPAEADSVTFPALPDALAAWRPSDEAVAASSVDWTTCAMSGIDWIREPRELFDQFVVPDLSAQASLVDARWLARFRTSIGWVSFATGTF